MLTLNGLDYGYAKGPFCKLSNQDTKGLDYGYEKGPYVLVNVVTGGASVIIGSPVINDRRIIGSCLVRGRR